MIRRQRAPFFVLPKQYLSEIRRYALLLVFPLVLGFVLFFGVRSVISGQVERQGRSVVRHFQSQADGVLREMQIVSDSILNDSRFMEYITSDRDTFDPSAMCSIISGKITQSAYVSSAFVLAEAQDRIYTGYAHLSYAGLPAILSSLRPSLDTLDENYAVEAVNIDSGWHISDGNYGAPYYVADIPRSDDMTTKLIVVTNMRAFLNTMHEPNAVLCCAFNDNISFSSQLKSYNGLNWHDPSAVAAILGAPVKCFYEEGSNLIYLAAISTGEYYAPLRTIVLSFCVYFLAVLIIGYLYLRSVSRRRYEEAMAMLEGIPHPTSRNPTYQDVISAVNHSLEEYRKSYGFQMRAEKREVLGELLTGGFVNPVTQSRISSVGLVQSDIGYYVAMISLIDASGITVYGPHSANKDLTCVILESAANSLAGNSAAISVTDIRPAYYAILSICDGALTANMVRDLFLRVVDAIEDKYGMRITVTVSSRTSSLSGLFDAYVEAKKLSDFVRSVDSSTSVLLREDLDAGAGILLNGDFLNQLQVLSRTLIMEKYEIIPQLTEKILADQIAKLGPNYGLANERLAAVNGVLAEAVIASDMPDEEKSPAVAAFREADSIIKLNAVTQRVFIALSRHEQETGLDPIVRHACDYIAENISDPYLSVPEISAAVEVSVQHLSRLFKKDTDNTIVEYINFRRIELAKKLLIEENYTVAKIAAASGYSNSVTFARNFRRYVGLSPTEYRTMNR